jgi:hypothetical protein
VKTINVEGLPEPIVRSLEVMVQAVREEISNAEKSRERVKLSIKKGDVLGPLTREEIYRDVGRTGFVG